MQIQLVKGLDNPPSVELHKALTPGAAGGGPSHIIEI